MSDENNRQGPGHGGSPQEVAAHLVKHSFFATLAFIVIVFIAITLGYFLDKLVASGIVTAGSYLYWIIHVAEYALGTIDIAMLVGVIGKTAWRLLRSI